MTYIVLIYISWVSLTHPQLSSVVCTAEYRPTFPSDLAWTVLAYIFLHPFQSLAQAMMVFHSLRFKFKFVPSRPPSSSLALPRPPCPLYLIVLPKLHQSCNFNINTSFLPFSLFSNLTCIYPSFYFCLSTLLPGLEPVSSFPSYTTAPPSWPVVSHKVPEELMVFFYRLSNKTRIHGWCHVLNYIRDSGWGQNKTEKDDHPHVHTYLSPKQLNEHQQFIIFWAF